MTIVTWFVRVAILVSIGMSGFGIATELGNGHYLAVSFGILGIVFMLWTMREVWKPIE